MKLFIVAAFIAIIIAASAADPIDTTLLGALGTVSSTLQNVPLVGGALSGVVNTAASDANPIDAAQGTLGTVSSTVQNVPLVGGALPALPAAEATGLLSTIPIVGPILNTVVDTLV